MRRTRSLHAFCLAWLLVLFYAAAPAQAQAQTKAPTPRTLALMLGDVESRPAVLAVQRLQAQLRDNAVAVRIIPTANLTAADHAALAGADVALVNVKGSQLLQSVAPDLDQLRRRGKAVYAVGAVPDDALRAQGFRADAAILDLHREGGVENVTSMLRRALVVGFGARIDVPPVRRMLDSGLFDVAANRGASDFDDYVARYARHKPGAPWIGVMFYRASLVAGQTLPLAAIVARLEAAGYNVLPAYGYPYETPLRLFLDAGGKSRIEALVALGMKVGGTAGTGALLERIGVPAINAITLSQHSVAQWEASKVGLDLMERTWQMAGAEIAGLIQPTVVASREKVVDDTTGLAYVEEQPIAERIDRLAARIDAWVALRRTPNAAKRVAILYYNYPHGSETIGAAYLNVLPGSLWAIGGRLRAEGYTVDGRYPGSPAALQQDIQTWGNYPGKGERDMRAGLDRLARSGEALLVPLADYRRWYDALPPALRASVERAWGPPERAPGLWHDGAGAPQFVFPARRYGNLLLAPQPGRAWEQNLAKLHNDVTLPPGHEYIAFYLWLQHGFDANAVVHVGTHGTQEWLTGKEAGLSASDATEALIGAMPNIYPYVMDDVGEGLQAKRRGMATIVDHMTPPFDAAGLNPDLRELGSLLNDYRVAEQKSPLLVKAHLTALNALAARAGVLKDMGRPRLATEADMEALEEYLDDTGSKLTPFGLHTFGVAPAPEWRTATARAVASLDRALDTAAREGRAQALEGAILDSAEAELAQLTAALNGRFIATGPSADLLRNPDALPTGRNFFGLDPARIPSRAVFEQGRKLATALVEDYRRRHGAWPDRLTMNLWGVETSRHEGVMEAQAMALMGVRPTWDERGRVNGVEAIPLRELGHPRVDVTMVSSGLFRDLFGNVLALLDQAAQLAQRQPDDGGNVLAAHTQAAARKLEAGGMAPGEAERLAGVRIFGLPSGAYGTNIEKLLPLSNVWHDEREVADVFINRMSHPFGNGYWGDEGSSPAQRREVFRMALSGSRIALHSRSSNLFATLDNDDFFQYLGGTALAIRAVDGATPEVVVSDLSDPRRPGHKTLGAYMGRELQSRYLNPRWADRMLAEGYSGGRFINRVVDYLWAWQVTVPDAVDGNTWQRMYDTYVADRFGLKARERIAAAGNLRAWQAMTDRMLTAIEKGYWKPTDAVRRRLAAENASAVAQAGAACGDDSCSRATLRLAPAAGAAPGTLAAAPAAATGGDAVADVHETAPPAPPAQPAHRMQPARRTPPSRAPDHAQPQQEAPRSASTNAGAIVSGFELESVSQMTPVQKTVGALALLACAIAAVGGGYVWRRRGVRL
jgi:cobaltochelatase CobN